jgi:hypothetical protein
MRSHNTLQMKNRPIAIDPGANGGIAWRDKDGTVRAIKMPDSLPSLVLELQSARLKVGSSFSHFVVEQVGSSMPGNSARASTTFARHCGAIDGIVAAIGASISYAPPKVWMKAIGIPPGMEKAARKNEIKRLMQEKHPHLRVTLSTADALGILAWAEEPF